jgi:predicted transport protein
LTQRARSLVGYGTGDLEITLANLEDLERAMPLIKRSYEES